MTSKVDSGRAVYGRKMYWLAALCLIFLAYIVYSHTTVSEEAAERQMASLLISRSNISKVEAFRDDSVMHGLKYFFFQASESDLIRVVRWLDLQKGAVVPDIFSERIEYAKVKSRWSFNWSTKNIYFAYYCHNNSPGWTVDLILIDGGNAVYITDGYMPNSVTKVNDFASCGERK